MSDPRAPSASTEAAARRAIFAAAALTALGIAVSATSNREVGGVALLVGWVAFVFSLHKLGRAGGARDGGESAPTPRSSAR